MSGNDDNNDDGANAGGNNDDGANAGGENKPTVAEQITAASKAAVTEVLGALGIDPKDTNDDKGGAVTDDNNNGAPAGGRTARDTETSVAAEVERQMARVRKDEQRDADLADVKAKVEAIAEKPPRKTRKITDWIWGRDE